MPTTHLLLSNEQKAFFQREGYLAIERIVPDEEVQRLRVIYDDLFRRRAGYEEGNMYDLAGTDDDSEKPQLPQILAPSRYAPELQETQLYTNGLRIAQELLGPEAYLWVDHAILKPGSDGAATPWHQDEAYWEEDKEAQYLSIWVPLQDTSVEMGCMQFLPGTHTWEVQPHHPINNDPRIHGLEIDSLDTRNAVACPLKAGGATVHTSRTCHYTGPNRTGKDRRAYIMILGLPPKPRAERRDFYWNHQRQTARMDRMTQANAGRNA